MDRQMEEENGQTDGRSYKVKDVGWKRQVKRGIEGKSSKIPKDRQTERLKVTYRASNGVNFSHTIFILELKNEKRKVLLPSYLP